jgi:hypothetical protein
MPHSLSDEFNTIPYFFPSGGPFEGPGINVIKLFFFSITDATAKLVDVFVRGKYFQAGLILSKA